MPIAGDVVVAHFDWRVEHVLVRDGRITTVYDWDSLFREASGSFLARAPLPSVDSFGIAFVS